MPFPIVHGVVASSLYIASHRRTSIAKDWKIILLCAVLSILPDADFALEWFFYLPGAHRGFTHSIAFSVGMGMVAWLLVGAKRFSQKLVLVLAPITHLLLDVLVTRKATGIQLLWPLSDYRFKLGLFDYFLFNLDPRFDPWSEILIQAFGICLIESLVMCPLFILLVFRKLREQNRNCLSA